MRDEKEFNKKLQRELKREAEDILQIVESDSTLKDSIVPPRLRESIFEEIQKPTEEEELIRLGRIYRRKLKNRKYVVLAASMVLVLALGMTSIGDVPNIFRKISHDVVNREQENVNSDDVETYGAPDEDAVYAEIEETYGFFPVKLDYRPEGIEFQEALFGKDIQQIQMFFGFKNTINIMYLIRPNYRDSSFAVDIEDTLISESQKQLEKATLYVKKYLIQNDIFRWSVQFDYENTTYLILISGLNENEIDKILNNLYFS